MSRPGVPFAVKYPPMRRRRFLSTAALLSLGTSLGAYRGTDRLADARLIRGKVGYYTNRGGTIGYHLPTGQGGGVVVDTQFPDAAQAFLDEVFTGSARLDLLINTHHHGDHTGGNGVVAPLAANYVSHARARTNLEGSEGDPVPLPTTVFDKEWEMRLPAGDETVTARHFGPAHTGGDAVIHFENANVAHLGDLLFNRRFPYIDPGAGGSLTNWAKVMGKIRKTYDRDTVFIFGHAAESYPVTGDRDDVASFRDYLLALRDYVRKEHKAGTTLEQLKAKTTTIPLAPEWRFGEGLRDVNLEVMWTELGYAAA